LAYRPAILSADEEANLVGHIADLPFKPFEFHGYLAKRRVVSFGWRYDYASKRLGEASPLPAFLTGLRDSAASAASAVPDHFRHALVTEYAPGAASGWHRDKSAFGEILAVSLLSACVLRLRRRTGERWERRSLNVQPRSFYMLRGPVRSEWEHSIPPVSALRYSVTFRTLAPSPIP
jgi:alkylated DNA repair dioxygenase AlkB